MRHRLDPEKCVATLLYVTRAVPSRYTALKVVYFADREHLSRYGRLMYGDTYIAMQHGPVPSAAYDIIKDAGGEANFRVPMPQPAEEYLEVQGNDVRPRQDPDLDLLSASDIECLDEAIQTYGGMSFNELKAAAHSDEAFLAADQNDTMALEAIARTLPDAEALIEHLNE